MSADSILFSIHQSYDDILKALETEVLTGDLQALLSGMRANLKSASASSFPAEVRADADVYLTIAESLLADKQLAPADTGSPELIGSLFTKAQASQGTAHIELFGVRRKDEDFSQFKPRGHYAGIPALERYFRAMMWLGRIDFRMLETQRDGRQLFHRRQLEAPLLLDALIQGELEARFNRIDRTITAFVGEHDYMRREQLASLLTDLGVASPAELAQLSDERIARAIVVGGYGTQRISSHIMINGPDEFTLPLSASFALLGQRYVIDSHVFTNVVYDRVDNAQVKRLMPNPLDVAYAVLGNDQAVSLLTPEFEKYPYAPALAGTRVLVNAHPPSFWGSNLYNLWLSSLRELSPDRAALSATDSGLFPAARSEAWGRRLLSTQLASWAELRHDTLLYAKQSYTAGVSCEFPDAYVDPYPKFYEQVRLYAEGGKDLIASLALPQSPRLAAISLHFETLADVATRLHEMAEYQRTGAPFTPDMLAFINDAVTVQRGCGVGGAGFVVNFGWYGKLFFDAQAALEFDPTIADVHTQPTDEGGNMVGRVLHVGTGWTRLMAVIVEGCSGPRAYLGLASSYHEQVRENFERLTDVRWKGAIESENAGPRPQWLGDLMTP